MEAFILVTSVASYCYFFCSVSQCEAFCQYFVVSSFLWRSVDVLPKVRELFSTSVSSLNEGNMVMCFPFLKTFFKYILHIKIDTSKTNLQITHF